MTLHTRYNWICNLLLGLFLLAGLDAKAQNVVPDDVERAALQAIYDNTNGATWTPGKRWRQSQINGYPDSVLYGINVDHGDVTGIMLDQVNMNGVLPVEMDQLTELVNITIRYNNNLVGDFPNLSSLTKLKNLDLTYNNFSGTFPQWISNLELLQTLRLASQVYASTQITGPIPASISDLENLTLFSLINIDLSASGSIPNSFSDLDNLQNLSLPGCHLTPASVSTGLSGLDALTILDLSRNPSFRDANGVFADVLYDLGNLQVLYLTNNSLSDLPSRFSQLGALNFLDISQNNFSNTALLDNINAVLKDCPALKTLLMINCNITALPASIADLSTVTNLYLNSNRTLDPAQCNVLGDMPALKNLYLYDCNLSDLPANLANSTSLEGLFAGINKLYPIPTLIKDIPNIKQLDLSNNNIAALPDWFGSEELADLTLLMLNHNKITLPLPANFSNLTKLTYLAMADNELEGLLPEYFSTFTELGVVYLNENKIASPLPDLSTWTKMTDLYLQHNNLTGAVPAYFSTLHIPKYRLDLGYNHLDSFTPFTQSSQLSLMINNNKFEFSDVLKQTSALNTYYYPSQDSVDVTKTLTAYEGYDLTLIAAVDTATQLNCRFQWFKIQNGVTTAISTSSTAASVFMVSDITSADIGTKFFYRITNSAAPQLTLTSRPQTLTTVIDEGDDGGGSTACESTLASEYYALMSFYHATNNGEGWRNKAGWKDANPNVVQSVVGWFGVTTDASGFVTGLFLDGNNLNGIIPSQIGNLKHLKEIHFSNNNLAGALPSSIGRLCKLEQLYIRNSRLTYSIPRTIGNLRELKNIRLDINEFTGTIPTSVGNLAKLNTLDLSFNRLTGAIPIEVSNLQALINLNLSANQLEGSIPAGLGGIATLKYLAVANNKLTGVIPPALGGLGELLLLDLSANQLDGSIPVSFGGLAKLRTLSLFINKLTGNIPSEIGNLLDLEFLSLTNNQLTGPIPTSIGNLTKLQYFYARNNHLSGEIPSSIGNCTSLRAIMLDTNELSGPIPTAIGNLHDLITLDLSYNKLTSLPSELGNLFNLKQLYIGSNQLANEIPTSFGNLQSAQYISLTNNQLIGTLPPSMVNLENLISLDVSFNRLSGDVPMIESLTTLNINVNKFTFTNFLPVKQGITNLALTYQRQDSVDVQKTIVALPGKQVTLTATVDRSTSPASKYQWFKIVNGVRTTVTPAPSTDAHTLNVPALSQSDNGVKYFYQITNSDAPLLTLVSRTQKIVFGCKAPDVNVRFTTRKYLCALKFVPSVQVPTSCRTANYNWDFGDGFTTQERIPLHAYRQAGTYSVTLRLNYNYGACIGDTTITKQVVFDPSENVLMDTLLEAETDVKEEVITASASTFSDVWPLLHDNTAIEGMNSFMNGTSGVWRNDGAYVHNTERRKSETIDIAKDGTFSMDHFNWEFAEYDMIPKWVKANNMTLYSPYSYELENRDVLGIYSAALYDYGGHLPSANGVNMRYAEMAFTSFEYLDGKVSGNWMFGTEPTLKNKMYRVFNANSNMAIVEMSLKELGTVQKVDVIGRKKIGFGRRRSIYIKDDEIVCSQPYPNNPDWTILVLKQAPTTGVWKGSIVVKKDVPPVISPDIDNNVAHSGKSSLKVTTSKIFAQNLLSLDSAKSYYVTCWVSVNNPNVATPKLADNLGFDVTVKNRDGLVVVTNSFQPTGKIIEGWQQIRGTFTCPVNNSIIEITFKPGSSGAAWYDDLRLHPEKGNMKSYVYNLDDYRLQAILDEENFASYFYYDHEGNLYLTKKETEEGVKTITENISYQREKQETDN